MGLVVLLELIEPGFDKFQLQVLSRVEAKVPAHTGQNDQQYDDGQFGFVHLTGARLVRRRLSIR